MTADPKELARTVREQRKALRDLTNAVLLYLDNLDGAVATRKDIPHDVSEWLGRNAGLLDMANDQVRYFALGVNYRTDNKKRAVAKLRKQVAR